MGPYITDSDALVCCYTGRSQQYEFVVETEESPGARRVCLARCAWYEEFIKRMCKYGDIPGRHVACVNEVASSKARRGASQLAATGILCYLRTMCVPS